MLLSRYEEGVDLKQPSLAQFEIRRNTCLISASGLCLGFVVYYSVVRVL